MGGILVADKCSSGLSNDDDDGYIADIILCLGIINSRVHVPWGWGVGGDKCSGDTCRR